MWIAIGALGVAVALLFVLLYCLWADTADDFSLAEQRNTEITGMLWALDQKINALPQVPSCNHAEHLNTIHTMLDDLGRAASESSRARKDFHDSLLIRLEAIETEVNTEGIVRQEQFNALSDRIARLKKQRQRKPKAPKTFKPTIDVKPRGKGKGA